MKVVILAGGLGTRIFEKSREIPKPMVSIGGYPLIWHVMKIYDHFGVKDFIICLGYKGAHIRDYFVNYFQNHCKDISVDLNNNVVRSSDYAGEKWNIHLVETGENTMTGGRLLAVKDYLNADEPFYLTYADGVGNIDLPQVLSVYKNNPSMVTLTCVKHIYQYGKLGLAGNYVKEFSEKPQYLINGGFYICHPKIFSFLKDSQSIFEVDCIAALAKENQLTAYVHTGFWHSVDTLRDKIYLQELWEKNHAPWMVWKDK